MLVCILLWLAASFLTPAVDGKTLEAGRVTTIGTRRAVYRIWLKAEATAFCDEGIGMWAPPYVKCISQSGDYVEREQDQRHPLPSSGSTSSSTTSSFVSEGDRAAGAPGMVVTTTSSMLTSSSVDANPDGGITAKTASMVMTTTSVTAQTGRGELTADSSTISSTATTSTSNSVTSAAPKRSRVGRSSPPPEVTTTTTTTTSTSTTTTTRMTVTSRGERPPSVGHRSAHGISGTENRLDAVDAANRDSELLEASHSVQSKGERNPTAASSLGKDSDCNGGDNAAVDVAHEGMCMA